MESINGFCMQKRGCDITVGVSLYLKIIVCCRVIFLELTLLLHRAFRRITLIINQQMHLHKISH